MKILVVEDNPDHADEMKKMAEGLYKETNVKDTATVEILRSEWAFLGAVKAGEGAYLDDFDVIILDYSVEMLERAAELPAGCG